jgi:hypothetical protein
LINLGPKILNLFDVKSIFIFTSVRYREYLFANTLNISRRIGLEACVGTKLLLNINKDMSFLLKWKEDIEHL